MKEIRIKLSDEWVKEHASVENLNLKDGDPMAVINLMIFNMFDKEDRDTIELNADDFNTADDKTKQMLVRTISGAILLGKSMEVDKENAQQAELKKATDSTGSLSSYNNNLSNPNEGYTFFQ